MCVGTNEVPRLFNHCRDLMKEFCMCILYTNNVYAEITLISQLVNIFNGAIELEEYGVYAQMM